MNHCFYNYQQSQSATFLLHASIMHICSFLLSKYFLLSSYLNWLLIKTVPKLVMHRYVIFFSFCSASHFISPSVVKCTIGGKTSHHSHHVNWVPTYVVVHNSILEGGDSFNVAHCYIWKFLKVFFVKMLNKIGIYIFSEKI